MAQKDYKDDKRIKRIGEKIKQLRLRKGYSSFEKFAYDHDLPRVGYGDHEKGKSMNLTSLLRILDIHGISLKEFFDDFE